MIPGKKINIFENLCMLDAPDLLIEAIHWKIEEINPVGTSSNYSFLRSPGIDLPPIFNIFLSVM